MAEMKTTYFKNGDGFIMNDYFKDGQPVVLFDKQAKYMLPPLGTELRREEKAPAKKAPAPAPVPAKKKPEVDAS